MASTPTSSFSNNSSKGASKDLCSTTPQKDLLPSMPDSTPDKKQHTKNLTPDEAAIDQIVQIVFDHSKGATINEDKTFTLGGQRVYDKLLDTLKAHDLRDHFDSLRYRWCSDLGEFTLQMSPHPIHQHLVWRLGGAIDHQLEEVLPVQYPELAQFCEKLCQTGTSSVQNKDGTFSQDPDAQWRYKDYEVPAFVLEVANTQAETKVLKVCQRYLDRFPNMLGGVLGINIYKPVDSKYIMSVFLFKASVDVNTPNKLDSVILKNIQFRVNSEPQNGCLEIPFELFLPPNLRRLIPAGASNACISLDFELLNKWAKRAEERQKLMGKGVDLWENVHRINKRRWYDDNNREVDNFDTILHPSKRPRT